MERSNSRGIPQVLNKVARDYLVACKNHVSLNMYRRVRRAFFVFVQATLKDTVVEMKSKEKGVIATHYMRRMTRQDTVVDEDEM